MAERRRGQEYFRYTFGAARQPIQNGAIFIGLVLGCVVMPCATADGRNPCVGRASGSSEQPGRTKPRDRGASARPDLPMQPDARHAAALRSLPGRRVPWKPAVTKDLDCRGRMPAAPVAKSRIREALLANPDTWGVDGLGRPTPPFDSGCFASKCPALAGRRFCYHAAKGDR
jgi:hypothetical protein